MPQISLSENYGKGGAIKTGRGQRADPKRMFALSMIRRAVDDAAKGSSEALAWIEGERDGMISFLPACKAARVSPDRVRRQAKRRVGHVPLADARKIDDLQRLKDDQYEWVTCQEAASRFPFTAERIAEVAPKDPAVTAIKAPRSKGTNRRCRYIRLDPSTVERFSSNHYN